MGKRILAQSGMALLCIAIIRTGHSQYTLPLLPLLIVICLLFLVATFPKLRIRDTKWLLVFLLVVTLEIPFQLFATHAAYNAVAALGEVLLLALMVLSVLLLASIALDIHTLLKPVHFFALLASGALVVQSLFYAAGIELFRIPILGEFLFTACRFNTSYRMCSLFSEPSHLAEFVMISLFYFLYIRPNYRNALLITVALVLSTSSLGIGGSVLLWGLLMVKRGGRRAGAKIALVLTGMTAAIAGIFWLTYSDHWLAARLLSGGSYSVRVLRSLELFAQMTPVERVFGIGLQNQALYLSHHGIILASDTAETLLSREFAQTLGYILCTTGLLGCLAYVSLWVSPVLHGRALGWRYVVLFAFVSITCCILSRPIMVLYLCMLYLVPRAAKEGG